MSRRLGRLFITWGPDARDYPRKRPPVDPFRNDRYELVQTFHDFHANALNNESDAFASMWFGQVVKSLLSGRTTVLTDRVFDDPQRRALVGRTFRRVFPELVVAEVQLGGEAWVVGGPEVVQPAIVIEEDVYGEGVTASNERIAVESDGPIEVLVSALGRAADRMMSVGEDGQEYADAETARELDIYTPNHVSEVTVDEDGNAGFSIDCKGAIERPMADQFRNILRQELLRGGVSSAHVRVADQLGGAGIS